VSGTVWEEGRILSHALIMRVTDLSRAARSSASANLTSGEWNNNDYDVLALTGSCWPHHASLSNPRWDAVDVDASLRESRIARESTATNRRARPQWQPFAKSWRPGWTPKMLEIAIALIEGFALRPLKDAPMSDGR
jgi:hypothetical protein